MTSSCMRVALNPMTVVLIRETEGELTQEKRKCDTEAEKPRNVKSLRTNQNLPFSPRRKYGSPSTRTSDFRLPELCENEISVVLSYPFVQLVRTALGN